MPDTAIPVSPASFAWLQPFASRNLRTSLPTPLIIPPHRGHVSRGIIKHGLPKIKTPQDVVWDGAHCVEKAPDVGTATRPARRDLCLGPRPACERWEASTLPHSRAPAARCGRGV